MLLRLLVFLRSLRRTFLARDDLIARRLKAFGLVLFLVLLPAS
jgi:hypothetical protein